MAISNGNMRASTNISKIGCTNMPKNKVKVHLKYTSNLGDFRQFWISDFEHPTGAIPLPPQHRMKSDGTLWKCSSWSEDRGRTLLPKPKAKQSKLCFWTFFSKSKAKLQFSKPEAKQSKLCFLTHFFKSKAK